MSEQQPDDESLPFEIANNETIVRAILTPWHYKRGRPKRQAFKPPAGRSVLSVMRLLMGANFCKDKAVEIGAANKNNEYCGLLTVRADAIRSTGSTVVDSRDPPNFLGHADIDHGFALPDKDDPPATPEELQRMDDRYDALLEHAKFHSDPAPEVPGWAGDPLTIESDA